MSLPMKQLKAHADLCEDWKTYQAKSKESRHHERAIKDGSAVISHNACQRPVKRSTHSRISLDLEDQEVDWPYDAHSSTERDPNDPLTIVRQPLYYREQRRHFDLRDGPNIQARRRIVPKDEASSSSSSGPADHYITPHGTIMKCAGWYFTAPQKQRSQMIEKMRRLWNFPEGPLGKLHAAMQVIASITPEYAQYLINPNMENDLPVQVHIASLTMPKFTEESEIHQANLIKRQLLKKFKMEHKYADDLILMALKYEGMKDAPTEIVVQHIKNKLEDPKQFLWDQFSLHKKRGLFP